mgnify:CR=1 FL=1
MDEVAAPLPSSANELVLELPNQRDAIESARQSIQAFLAPFEPSEQSLFRVELVLEEQRVELEEALRQELNALNLIQCVFQILLSEGLFLGRLLLMQVQNGLGTSQDWQYAEYAPPAPPPVPDWLRDMFANDSAPAMEAESEAIPPGPAPLILPPPSPARAQAPAPVEERRPMPIRP